MRMMIKNASYRSTSIRKMAITRKSAREE